MPTYKTTRAKIASMVASVEKKGEQVVSIVDVTTFENTKEGEFLVLSVVPEETTGRAWLPSSEKETRA